MNRNLLPNLFSSMLGSIQTNEMGWHHCFKQDSECNAIPHVIFYIQSTVPMSAKVFLPLIWNLMLSHYFSSRKDVNFVPCQLFYTRAHRIVGNVNSFSLGFYSHRV